MTHYYHGTTAKSWRANKKSIRDLYLITSIEDARRYACDAGESEWDDDIHSEGGLVPELIVVTFSIEDIEALAATGKVELQPDWGWVRGVEQEAERTGLPASTPTWKESMEAVGSLVVSGFSAKHKALGSIAPAFTAEVDERATPQAGPAL
jgi:hypothetical protein